MRAYTLNSPQAAARVLALMLIADGNVCDAELRTLNRLHAEQRLGLPVGGLDDILRELCEDIYTGTRHESLCLEIFDEGAMRGLMAEVTDPWLRSEVLTLAHAAAEADQHLAQGEGLVLAAAEKYWCLKASTRPLLHIG